MTTLAEINEFSINMHRAIAGLAPRTNRLVHYTTLASAYAIIDSQVLRFASARSTNDPSEFEFGLSVVEAAIAELQREYGGGPYECLRDLQFYLRNRAFKAFVFCLTEADPEEAELGELSQWRLYGGEGRGVALVFDLEAEERRSQIVQCGSLPRRVVYGYDSGVELVCSVAREFIQFIDSVAEEDLRRSVVGPIVMQEHLVNSLFWLPSVIKHRAYRHEREVRMIRGDIGSHAGNPLVFVDKAGMKKPAIERPFTERVGAPPADRIVSPLLHAVVGPASDQAAVVDSLTYYLEARNWHLPLRKSGIPFRAVL